jgi:ABC-type branched-subunit amino acid transport system ATPase component
VEAFGDNLFGFGISQLAFGLDPTTFVSSLTNPHSDSIRPIFEAMLTFPVLCRLAALSGRKGPWNQKRICEFFAVLGERKNTLAKMSGGEQQMLAIARALIANPEIILLDEPMEGLAPLIARNVEEVVRAIRSEGNTILLVEQDANVAMSLSDRGYILAMGRVMASGTIDEVRADTDAMQRYLAV